MLKKYVYYLINLILLVYFVGSKDWFVLWVIGFLVYLICFFGVMLNIKVWLNFRKLNEDVKIYVFVNFV